MHHASFEKFSVFALGLAVLTGPALAEPPMHVDDAGTLGKGGLKFEGALRRDDQQRGGELVFGFAAVAGLEIGLSLARAFDQALEPSSRLTSKGIGFKFVSLQNETGWSLGVSFGYGRTKTVERATPDAFTGHERAVTALATYRSAAGHAVHLNLGALRSRSQGASETVGVWGAGYEHPLGETLKLTAEIFGEEHARPDKALGLRFTVFEGFKVSAAVGRGNGRSFGQAGFTWEF